MTFNSIWRFLALREYVDQNHELTAWGQVLVTSVEALAQPELEEAVVLAVELLRLGILNGNADMFNHQGAPMRGEGESPGLLIPVLSPETEREQNSIE